MAATPPQRVVEGLVGLLGRPAFFGFLALLVFCWVAANLVATSLGYTPLDPPPFAWLELAASLAALCFTVLILATQRREDQLAQRREQITLELAVLSEQKLAKIIELLEESRRDNPLLDNRANASAEAMAKPADPYSLGEARKGR